MVFYVDFPDCRYDYAPTVDELQTITFGAADPSNVNYPFESIPAFYSRASKESMNFDGRVFRYTTKESASAYGKDKVKIAEECYEAFKDTVDFSQYDGNNSGIGSNIGWGIIPGEGIRVYHIDATTEYGGNNYFRYASGSEFTDSDRGRRLIRIIDDTDTDNFYHSGDVINGSISGFHWYDPNGSQTVDTGYTVTIGSLENSKYTVTVSK